MPSYSKKALLALCERALKNLPPNHMTRGDCPEIFEEVAKFYAALKFCDVAFRVTEDTDGYWIRIEYRFPTHSSIERGVISPAKVLWLPGPRMLDEVEKHGTWC